VNASVHFVLDPHSVAALLRPEEMREFAMGQRAVALSSPHRSHHGGPANTRGHLRRGWRVRRRGPRSGGGSDRGQRPAFGGYRVGQRPRRPRVPRDRLDAGHRTGEVMGDQRAPWPDAETVLLDLLELGFSTSTGSVEDGDCGDEHSASEADT
jgi:hypothetical protein